MKLPISRSVGGYPRSVIELWMYCRTISCRCVSFCTFGSLPKTADLACINGHPLCTRIGKTGDYRTCDQMSNSVATLLLEGAPGAPEALLGHVLSATRPWFAGVKPGLPGGSSRAFG